MARSFHKNKKPRDRFTVEIESLDQDGRGVAHREGKAVFVEGALPHEVVTYERIRNKTSFEIGRLVELHNEGPLRVKPRCPHFGLEPGCCGPCGGAGSHGSCTDPDSRHSGDALLACDG